MPFPGKNLQQLIQLHMLPAVAVSFISGGLAAGVLELPGPPLRTVAIAALILFTALFLIRRKPSALPLLVPAFFLAGLVHTGLALLPPESPRHLSNLVPERTRVTLSGQVLDMPEYDGRLIRFVMAADGIRFHRGETDGNGLEPAHGRVRLSMESPVPPPDISPGDRLLLLANIGRASSYQTPGVFDYRLYLADRNIYVTGWIPSPVAMLTFKDTADSSLSRLRFLPERVRSRVAGFLAQRFGPETAGIYQALLIGSRAAVPDGQLEQFKATGCMHLLAISGLHMGLLGLIFTVSLAWLMKRSTWLMLHIHVPTAAAVLSLVPLAGYAFIAGLNTPVVRALLMAAFFLVGVVLQRQRSIFPVIAAAAVLLLLLRPLALFTASFQLSFASVLAIGMIYPRLLELLAVESGGLGSRAAAYLLSAFLVSVAATLGSLPFMLIHFNRFSLIGPVMNLLVEPVLCLWALPLGLAAIILLPFTPPAAGALLEAGAAGIAAADRMTGFAAGLPFASVWTITPTMVETAAYFFILGLWLRLLRNRTGRGLLTAALLTILLGCSFTRGLWLDLPDQRTEAAFLDVGQGSSSLLTLPGGTSILIDGGSNTSPHFDIGRRVIAPFLWYKRLWRLDEVVITHPDSDHYNGLAFIIRRFGPKRLWINGDRMEHYSYRRLLALAEESGMELMLPEQGEILAEAPPATVGFVTGAGPAASEGLSVNDRSLVLMARHGQVSFLFPGDIGSEGEQLLLASGADLSAEVLLAPHHGSSGSSSPQFISAVDPDIVVVSSGRSVRGSYYDQKHRQRWAEAGRKVLATVEQGTVTISTDGERIFIE